MDNTNVNQNQTSNRPDRRGSNNPMFGRTHSQQSRNKMSQSHKAYQQSIRSNQSNTNQNRNYVMQPMTMQDFLSNHPSMEDYLKQLAKKVVKEEIDKFMWREKNQRFSIPI